MTLVSRSIGGTGGDLSSEQHAGLIVQLPDGRSFIVQGGPQGGKLRGISLQVSGDPFKEFSQARGADWDNPSATRTLPQQVGNIQRERANRTEPAGERKCAQRGAQRLLVRLQERSELEQLRKPVPA